MCLWLEEKEKSNFGARLIMSEASHFLLAVNENLCDNCKKCEKKIPKFLSEYQGKIKVPRVAYEREDVQQGIKHMIEICKAGAISLKQVSQS